MEQLLKNLRKSNLLNPEQWKTVRKLVGGGRTRTSRGTRAARRALEPAELAGLLVEQGLVTRWQADMLLKGKVAFYWGKYKLLDCVGGGGMAGVFKARHQELGRLVAIKMLRGEVLKNRNAVARFRQEIQAVAALDDPRIVVAYDAGRSAGMYYLVMEFIDGKDLGHLVRERGPMPVGLACECIRQAAKGLQHAHEQGMVHRDIKPTNLLITKDPESGRPLIKILDLGLARFVSEEVLADSADSGMFTVDGSLTQIGQFLGTPDYISPEQAQDTRSADIRSDIYSLGCTLYRLLTGALPFPGDTVTAKLEARAQSAMPRASALRREVPPALDAVVARMLAHDPCDRYQTPSEVAQAVAPFATREWDRYLEGPIEPAAAKPIEPSGDDPRLEEFLRSLATQAEGAAPATAVTGTETRLTRRTAWLLASALAFCAAISVWSSLNPSTATLAIDWPLEQREGAALVVDGRAIRLGLSPACAVTGRGGTWRIRLEREGFETIEETISLQAGERRAYVPSWHPTAKSQRRAELQSVEDLVASAARPDATAADVNAARTRLLAFLRTHAESTDAAEAAKLASRLHWPLDRLSAPVPDRGELRWVAASIGQKSSLEPVGVFGSGRLMFWNAVIAVCVDGEGRFTAAVAADGTVRVFDVADGTTRQVFEPASLPTDIAFSPAEPLLAIAEAGGAVALWHIESGAQQCRIPNSFGPAAFSPDGRLLAVRASRQEIALYDAATGELRRTLLGHATGKLLGLSFSHNGKMLASHASDQSVMLWDVASGQERRRFPQAQSPLFSPNDTYLAAGAVNGDLVLWDTQTGETQRTLDEAGYPLSFSDDGQTLISKRLGRAILWSRSTGEELRTVVEVPERAAVSPDGQRLAGGDEAFGELRVWNLAETGAPRALPTIGPVAALAFTPDSSLLVAGTREHAIQIWSARSWEPRDENTRPIAQADLSADGRLLAAREGSRVFLMDVPTGERVRSLADDAADFDELRFSPDGRVLAGYGGWGLFKTSLRLWDAATGQELALAGDLPGTVRTMAFSADSRFLATAGDSRMATVWDLNSRSVEMTLEDFPERVVALAFHPDGKRLAAACQDQSVALRDLAGGKGKKLASPGAACRRLAFSPDGKLLAGLTESRIVLWNVAQSQIVAELALGGRGAGSVAFHPAEGSLVAAGHTGEILIWNDPARERQRDEPDAVVRIGPPQGIIRRVFWALDGRHLLTVNGNGTVYVLRAVGGWEAAPEDLKRADRRGRGPKE